jgi:threonine aldolase
MRIIDLRSDTVTLPSPAMRAAMHAAPLGDDVYGEDPTVNELEARAAAELGKEAAVFVPSGTMGNLLAVLSHTRPGDELVCGRSTHTYIAEAAGAARIAGVSVWPVSHTRGRLDPDEVAAGFHSPDDAHYPRTALVVVEQPHQGWVVALDSLAAIADLAHRRGLAVHMDGARIFNAAIALGVPARAIAAHADSVMFCISKGLAAPVGSLLVGSADVIAQARRHRKALGGAMRQAGVLAAAGVYALEHMVERLADDHANARRLADGLRDQGWRIDRAQVETNIFFAEPPAAADVHAWRRAGVLVASRYSGGPMRLVTHYGIESEDIERALEVFNQAAVPA